MRAGRGYAQSDDDDDWAVHESTPFALRASFRCRWGCPARAVLHCAAAALPPPHWAAPGASVVSPPPPSQSRFGTSEGPVGRDEMNRFSPDKKTMAHVALKKCRADATSSADAVAAPVSSGEAFTCWKTPKKRRSAPHMSASPTKPITSASAPCCPVHASSWAEACDWTSGSPGGGSLRAPDCFEPALAMSSCCTPLDRRPLCACAPLPPRRGADQSAQSVDHLTGRCLARPCAKTKGTA